jgi:hypothetical protein
MGDGGESRGTVGKIPKFYTGINPTGINPADPNLSS